MGKYLKWVLIAGAAYLVYSNWEMIKGFLPTKKEYTPLPKHTSEEIQLENEKLNNDNIA